MGWDGMGWVLGTGYMSFRHQEIVFGILYVAFCRIIKSDSIEVEKNYIGKKNLLSTEMQQIYLVLMIQFKRFYQNDDKHL